MRSLSLLAFLLFGAGVSGASFEDDIESAIFQQASSKTAMDELHRNLQMIEIDFTPDADPQLICDAFQVR